MKKRNVTILSVAIVIALSISSCCCSKKVCNTTSSSIESSTWKLENMNGKVEKAFATGDSFTLKFNVADSAYSGVAACNRIFGKFILKGDNALDIKAGASTMMACPDMELERPYIQMLDEADKYKLEKGKLILYKDGKKVAEFKAYTEAATKP